MEQTTYLSKEEMNEIAQQVCDDYCRFPRKIKEDIEEYCDKCPISKLVAVSYEVRVEENHKGEQR